MTHIWSDTFRRRNLILLAVMLLGVPMAQAQNSLEDLQKRKAIAEAEKAAIEAETARDMARKKQSESVAPLDPAIKAKSDAVEAVNSANAKANANEAQTAAHSLCLKCLKATQDESKKCLENAISQEDKKSCLEKQDTRAKACDNGECKLERAPSGNKGEVLPESR